MTTRYRSNTPRFVDETLDGEALIMDMLKGNYYCCVGASALAWNALKAGASASETAAALARVYGLSAPDIAHDVERFAGELVAEEMIVEADGALAPASIEPAPGTAPATDEYESLGLERYTDLADLILLDPVHDVGEGGWPRPTS
ncbi:MAG TPA: PqqD family protein [Acidimicrobiia bacterium]|nr:PqqD family protein [Acidimicrobiia bacterium]